MGVAKPIIFDHSEPASARFLPDEDAWKLTVDGKLYGTRLQTDALMPAADPLIRLLAPVPPMLEQALGYHGNAELVAFYWTPGGDELAYRDSDGNGCVGANWSAWLNFVRHPVIEPFLRPFDLGCSDMEAKHWLLLDRMQRVFYVGNAEDIAKKLDGKTAKEPGETTEILETDCNRLIENQVAALNRAVAEWDDEAFPSKLIAEQDAVRKMAIWLDDIWRTVKD